MENNSLILTMTCVFYLPFLSVFVRENEMVPFKLSLYTEISLASYKNMQRNRVLSRNLLRTESQVEVLSFVRLTAFSDHGLT